MAIKRLAPRNNWTTAWAPGANLSGLFSLYPSLGDVTLAANLATTLDGPMQVFRYGALTINTARTVTNRCRGAVILCDSLAMGASGSFSMTAKGAAGSVKWANQDVLVPTSAVFSGKHTDRAAFLAYLAATGYAIFDPTLFACPPPGMGDVVADYTSWPGRGTTIISAAGCGAGAWYNASVSLWGASYMGGAGNAGGAGSQGCGGGGSGCWIGYGGTQVTAGAGMAGHPWGGGFASLGAAGCITDCADRVPDGLPGGVILVIVRGNVSLTTGHTIDARSFASGNAGAGSPGGGFAGLYYSGSLSGTPNILAGVGSNNGALTFGNVTYSGGAGGAGSAQAKTFATMGW